MVAKILITEQDGTPPQICFGDFAGDFSPTGANDLRGTSDTEVQFAPASLANGLYRQSAKFDFGTNRARAYSITAAIEWAATPTAKADGIYLWLAPSISATAGTANAAGVSGASAAYTGYSSNAANSILQANQIGIGASTVQASATVQIIECGYFEPTQRYGSLVLLNNAGSAFHSDDVEIHVVFTPIVDESQ